MHGMKTWHYSFFYFCKDGETDSCFDEISDFHRDFHQVTDNADGFTKTMEGEAVWKVDFDISGCWESYRINT